ncbi:MAG: hypothetical protein RBU37_20935 [Myxococcota bacterium]|nr:hypothetical protein [Myxococcota bacterium]
MSRGDLESELLLSFSKASEHSTVSATKVTGAMNGPPPPLAHALGPQSVSHNARPSLCDAFIEGSQETTARINRGRAAAPPYLGGDRLLEQG